jgi:hypothetical protein
MRDKPVSLSLGFASDEFGYLIDLGLPAAGTTAFQIDPGSSKSAPGMDRRGPVIRLRTQDDGWNVVTEALSIRYDDDASCRSVECTGNAHPAGSGRGQRATAAPMPIKSRYRTCAFGSVGTWGFDAERLGRFVNLEKTNS